MQFSLVAILRIIIPFVANNEMYTSRIILCIVLFWLRLNFSWESRTFNWNQKKKKRKFEMEKCGNEKKVRQRRKKKKTLKHTLHHWRWWVKAALESTRIMNVICEWSGNFAVEFSQNANDTFVSTFTTFMKPQLWRWFASIGELLLLSSHMLILSIPGDIKFVFSMRFTTANSARWRALLLLYRGNVVERPG